MGESGSPVSESATDAAVRCPRCGTRHIRRAATRGIGERLRRIFTTERPYHCGKCKHRWMMPAQDGD